MLKKKYLIEKRNVLNEMREHSMTMQEIRFFSIYLSKINARDIKTREVSFPLEDFSKIMDLEKTNIPYIDKVFNTLLQKTVKIPFETEKNRGFSYVQLFKKCTLSCDKTTGKYHVTINAHDDALPLMFEFKEKYFTYELWNALKLKSKNQLRLYEFLKQYEDIGFRVIDIQDLKDFLGIDKDDYERFYDFDKRILEKGQKALKENTDICFEYEPIKVGRKYVKIKFTIMKNENFVDTILLDEFIDKAKMQEEPESVQVVETLDGKSSEVKERQEVIVKTKEEEMPESLLLLAAAVKDEFSTTEMEVIFQTICTKDIEPVLNDIDLGRFHFLSLKYAEMNNRHAQNHITYRFAYFLKMIM